MSRKIKDPLLQALYVAIYKLADDQLDYILKHASDEELQHFHVIAQEQLPTIDQFLEGIKVSVKYKQQHNMDKIQAKDQLIKLLYSQVMDLTMMSKIELGNDVIAEIKRLKDIINE